MGTHAHCTQCPSRTMHKGLAGQAARAHSCQYHLGALARPRRAGRRSRTLSRGTVGLYSYLKGECVTLLAVNGGPWRGGGGNRAVPVPKRAPHTAPGSDQPLVAGPCTASNRERPGGQQTRTGPPHAHWPSLAPRAAPPLPGETHRTGSSRKCSLHDTAPYRSRRKEPRYALHPTHGHGAWQET